MLDQQKLIDALKVIRFSLCAYQPAVGSPQAKKAFERSRTGSGRCDCKFGVTIDTVKYGNETGSGCPEILQAIQIISRLQPNEFGLLMNRQECLDQEINAAKT